MMQCNCECFHSALAFCSDLTSMKIRNKDWKFYFGLWFFKCNLKIFCCSAFVMKDMYGKRTYDENPIFLYWDLASKSSTKLLSESFALYPVQVGCWLRTSPTVSHGSHTYDYYYDFLLRKGTHPTRRITPKPMRPWLSDCFLLHFKSVSHIAEPASGKCFAVCHV